MGGKKMQVERVQNYMAMLRNARNILDADVSPAHIERLCAGLENPKAIRESRQFPFRWLAAYKEIQNHPSSYASRVLTAIERAAILATANIEGFDVATRVLVATDNSGSMVTGVTKTMSRMEVGNNLAALLLERCDNVVAGAFGTAWAYGNFPRGRVLDTSQKLGTLDTKGWATNGHLPIEWATREKRVFDKFLVFTDCQLWDTTDPWGTRSTSAMQTAWNRYRAEVNPNARLYLFDLAGYGTSPVNMLHDKNVAMIAGWSSAVFDALAHLERGGDVLDIIRGYA